MKRLLTILLIFSVNCFGQTINEHKAMYKKALQEQIMMLQGKTPLDFKKSVFLVENAYHKNKLNYTDFCNQISSIGQILRKMIVEKGLNHYKTSGNWATFTYLTDTIPENKYKPYIYDFDDFEGRKDFSKQFVSKLLRTKGGNCHSLPFLYKLLANEIGAKSSLALAPNHCYIKHQNEEGQWINVEMTNASFPRDQWMIKSMAISVDAIRQGTYMRPLTPKEEICFTIFDLASAYEHQFGNDEFVIEVSNVGLKYFPNCLELCMTKNNALIEVIEKGKKKAIIDTAYLLRQASICKANMKKINELGYKDMPKEQYLSWVKFIEQEKLKRQRTSKQK
jgi:hypothetical protein